MRKLLFAVMAMVCLLLTAPGAAAVEAEDLSGKEIVSAYTGFTSPNQLFDGIFINTLKIREGGSFTLTHEKGIGSLYIMFDIEYGPYTVTNEATGESHTFGEEGYLHEFLDLEATFGEAPVSVTVSFETGPAKINELYAYSSGEVPGFVQKWEPPAEGEADLVLFSTHGDDEQLFFAGLLPYYAAELDYHVQVVYLTDHRNMTNRRVTEMLNGLWAVGVRHYPVLGHFGDYQSSTLAEARMRYRNKGYTEEELLRFVVENIRRFRPKVAVGHDLNGEYGHGMHMLYADYLCQAVEVSGNPAVFPDLAEKYDVWDVPKTYLHLYQKNKITVNWDISLESFDGMTAFEVTKKLGFPCHVSQQTYYHWYFAGIEKAADIPEYSPCEYGLYRTTVGDDEQCNDLFEHMTTHAQDRQLEAQWKAEEEARQAAGTEAIRRTEPSVPVSTEQPAEVQREESSILLPLATGALFLALAAVVTTLMNRGKKH